MHIYKLRRVTLNSKLRAKLERSIEVWSNEVLELDINYIGLRGSPTVMSKIEFMPKVPRKKEVFSGDDVRAAKWLVNKLIDGGVLNI